MAPGIAEGTSWRALVGVAIPLLLAALIFPHRGPEGKLPTATGFHARPVMHLPDTVFRSMPASYGEGDDLRGYVERAKSRLDDPLTMYYVAQALEECNMWGTADDDLPPGHSQQASVPAGPRTAWLTGTFQSLVVPLRGHGRAQVAAVPSNVRKVP